MNDKNVLIFKHGIVNKHERKPFMGKVLSKTGPKPAPKPAPKPTKQCGSCSRAKKK